MTACAVTGHGPSQFHFGYDESHLDCAQIKQRLKKEFQSLIQTGVTTFLSGMELGVDL